MNRFKSKRCTFRCISLLRLCVKVYKGEGLGVEGDVGKGVRRGVGFFDSLIVEAGEELSRGVTD